jgi:hypothetical protein
VLSKREMPVWHESPAPAPPCQNGHWRLNESWNYEHDLRSNWLLWDVPPLQDNNVNHRYRWDHHCDRDGYNRLIHAVNAMPIDGCCMSRGLHCRVWGLILKQAAHLQPTPQCSYPLLG